MTTERSLEFKSRAIGYVEAHRAFPSARALDLLPYAFIIRCLGLDHREGAMVCDAFCGPGFLSSGLNLPLASVFAVDSVPDLVAVAGKKATVRTLVDQTDFRDFADVWAGRFDLIMLHGGLHHVHDGGNGAEPGVGRQAVVLANLLAALSDTGVLVVADAVLNQPEAGMGIFDSYKCSLSDLLELLEPRQADSITRMLSPRHGTATLHQLCDWVFTAFPSCGALQESPCHFLQDVVDKEGQYGHKASYPDFDVLASHLVAGGAQVAGAFRFPSSWVFEEVHDLVAFARSMFELRAPTDPQMHQLLRPFLNTCEASQSVYLPWAVQMMALKKGHDHG